MRQCVGAVVFGFPRWTVSGVPAETRLVGEFNHYEGAVALTHGLPLLLLKEEGVEDRGVVWNGGGKPFEAGYFMSSKGPERCLIVRHGEAKMPANAGGSIYVHLGKAADVGSIEGQLGDFLAGNL